MDDRRNGSRRSAARSPQFPPPVRNRPSRQVPIPASEQLAGRHQVETDGLSRSDGNLCTPVSAEHSDVYAVVTERSRFRDERLIVGLSDLQHPVLLTVPLPKSRTHLGETVRGERDECLGIECLDDQKGIEIAAASEVDHVPVHPLASRVCKIPDLDLLTGIGNQVVAALDPARGERAAE